MIQFHELRDLAIDISSAVSRHSADETFVYKTVSGEPVYLGCYLPPQFLQGGKYPLFIFIHGGGWTSHKVFNEQLCFMLQIMGWIHGVCIYLASPRAVILRD